jgi:hypothetical protein
MGRLLGLGKPIVSGDPNARRISMLPERQHRAFGEFYKSARYNEILEPKTTLMLHLAAAMAVACYP